MGDVIELPEKELGMGSELVSCMPGFIASIFDVITKSAEEHTEIPHDQVVRMVLQTMIATGELMLKKNMSKIMIILKMKLRIIIKKYMLMNIKILIIYKKSLLV